MFLLGSNTCVPLSWACKKQGAVSHSSTEAEIISFDFGMRCEGLPMLTLWEEVINVMYDAGAGELVQRTPTHRGMYEILSNVDDVSTTRAPRLRENVSLRRQRCGY